MSRNVLRVVIAGAGAMARKHAQAYRQLPGAEVTAVCNRDEARARAFCKEFSVPASYRDVAQAIAREVPDIVSVCVPTALHPEISRYAMEHGAHVVTEKPIALTVEEAEQMIAASQAHGKKLTVIFNRRFNTVWNELGRRIGSVGSPVIYNTQEIRSIRPKPAMHSASANGGPVIDCCVHDFDMLISLWGMPRSVFASGTVFARGKSALSHINDFAVDTAHIDVEFDGGNRAYLLYAWGFPQGPEYWQYREFMGPDGIVRLLGEFGEEVEHYRKDGVRERVTGLVDNGHETIIAGFVDAVQKGGDVPVRPEDALSALRVSLAALRSITSRRRESV